MGSEEERQVVRAVDAAVHLVELVIQLEQAVAEFRRRSHGLGDLVTK